MALSSLQVTVSGFSQGLHPTPYQIGRLEQPRLLGLDLIHSALQGRRGFAMERQAGFFDVDERLQRLSDLGDQLEAYAATVDFEIFRSPLERRWPMRMA